MSDMHSAMKKVGYSRDRRPRGAMPTLPESYFSIDDQGKPCLDPDFVSKRNIDRMAQYFAYEAKPRLTTAQVRRFFSHCRMIERRLTIDGETWQRVSAGFEMLSCHAQNAKAAGKIPGEFRDFVDANVSRVVSSEDPRTSFLDGLLPHFEALVGFSAAHLKSLP